MIPLPDLSHLLKYPNATVQYDDRTNGWETKRAQLTPKKLCWLWDNPSAYRNLRLVLRPIHHILNDELKECFRLAFGFVPTQPLRLGEFESNHCISIDGPHPNGDEYVLLLYQNGVMEAMLRKSEYVKDTSVGFNARAVVDYLRSLGYDIDGYLASGKAVEKEN